MTYASPVARAPLAPATRPRSRSAGRIASLGALAVLALITVSGIGYALGIDPFSLPSCGAEPTLDVLNDIFKDKNVAVERISRAATVADNGSEKACTAHVDAARERGNIDYRIYWEGWNAKVMITHVDAQPI
jgi:hypothetical protein